MGAEYLSLENGFTGPSAIGPRPTDVLPEVLPETFEQIATGLSGAQVASMLRQRLVPLASPAGQQFYADAAPWRRRHLQSRQIVAHVAEPVFAKTVWQKFSHAVAKRATQELKQSAPALSAHRRMTPIQYVILAVLATAMADLFVLLPFEDAARLFCLLFSLVFAAMIWIRVMALVTRRPMPRHPPEMDDRNLPTYSVLVPLFREANVLPQLIRSLLEISYPADKLDIKIILEQADIATRKAALRMQLPPHIELLVVPAGRPQTKPRALNYGLQFARGELLTIYDAEDTPHPMQLRRAANAFAHLAPRVACLQARLAFHNRNENWLSQQFAVEYAVQFGLILPALARYRLPLPLGGTSNHFRTAVLRHVHGWDAFNVTEDADIGLRMARLGFRCGVLNSTTLEEANVQLPNWLSQRARWLKGFLQTWLVHMRQPLALRQQIGWIGFLAVQSTLLGVMLSALLHPLFLGIMVWRIINGTLVDPSFKAPWFGLDNLYIAPLVLSYAVMLACGAVASNRQRLNHPVWVIATMPAYWILTSLAGWIALWQFITRPFHWNKTKHGLSKRRARQRQARSPDPTSSPA